MFASVLRRWYGSQPTVRSSRCRARRPLSLECLEGRMLLAGPDITILDGTTELTAGSATPIDIGSVGRGELGPTRVFTVRNDGTSNLQLTSLSLPVGFTLVDGPKTSLVPRSLDTFTVRLDSTVVGTPTGVISIGSNDLDETPFSFVVSGTVTPNGPKITVRHGADPILDGTQATIPFGGVVLGKSGPVLTFTIRNDGNQPLTIASIMYPLGYTLTDPPAAAIAPLGSDTFSIKLLSSSTGKKSGSVSIISNDPDIGTFDFPITGLVTATAVPSLTVMKGFTVLTSGDSTVNVGKVIKGQTGPSATFTVRNDGTAPVSFSDITVPAGFHLIDDLDSTLDPLETDSFVVQLDSADYGTPTGEITIDSNDPEQSPFHFTVTGIVVGNAPEIRVFLDEEELTSGSGSPVVFDPVAQGKVGSTLTFVVANYGVKDLTLGAVTLPVGFKLVAGLPATLPPDTFGFLIVRLDGKAAGTKSGDISFHTNDADEDPFTIPISGTVVASAPEIAVAQKKTKLVDGSAAAFAFGDGALGQPGPTQTFTVRNEGRAPLTLGSLTLPAGFTLVEGLVSTLGPGKSDTFTVQLDTGVLGVFSGEISLVSDDADENPFNFLITAEVKVAPVPEITVLNGNDILDSGDPNPIDLGTTAYRKKGSTVTLTVRNDGDADLNLASLELPAGFAVAKGLLKRLAPGRTATLQLRLDSRSVGDKSGQLIIHSDDADEPAFSIELKGTVV